MARIHHRKARKDYPCDGIAKGDMYYYCQFKTGPRSSRVIRQKEPIKRWQTTTSDYFATLWQLQDGFNGTDAEECNEAAQTLRELAEQCEERLEAMPEGLQEGDTGQTLQKRANACNDAADELENIASEWDDLDEPDDSPSDPSDYAEELSDMDPEDHGEFLSDKEQEKSDALDAYQVAVDELVERATDAVGGVE